MKQPRIIQQSPLTTLGHEMRRAHSTMHTAEPT